MVDPMRLEVLKAYYVYTYTIYIHTYVQNLDLLLHLVLRFKCKFSKSRVIKLVCFSFPHITAFLGLLLCMYIQNVKEMTRMTRGHFLVGRGNGMKYWDVCAVSARFKLEKKNCDKVNFITHLPYNLPSNYMYIPIIYNTYSRFFLSSRSYAI